MKLTYAVRYVARAVGAVRGHVLAGVKVTLQLDLEAVSCYFS